MMCEIDTNKYDIFAVSNFPLWLVVLKRSLNIKALRLNK